MRRYRYITSLILLLLTVVTMSSYAQETKEGDDVVKVSYSGVARKYTIADIAVTGIPNMDQKMLLNLSGLKVGQVVSIPGDELTQAVKRYLGHGLFSDAKVYVNKVEDNNAYIEIALKERPRLTRIAFHGIKKSEIKDVEPKVAIMEGTQVTPFLITRAEKYVKQYFVGKGFYNVDVKITQRNDPKNEGFVILDCSIDKKEKVKVKSLVFRGNKVMPYRKLNRAMKKTNEKALYNFFRTKKFIDESYQADLVKLIEFYNKNGYRDARVLKDEVVRNDDNTVSITIDIEEGRQYYLGEISWVGNSIYSGETLSSILQMKKGDVYNSKKMNKRLKEDEDAVSNAYYDNGYLGSYIIPLETNVYGDTIDIEMRVNEGNQYTIREVIIKGNDKTHERVVRREIRTKPGQLFSKSELIRTVRELANLGHFDPEKMNPVPVNDDDASMVDIIYNLEEKSNDQVEVSGGYGAGMFVGSLGLSFNNFSLRNLFNKEAYSPLPTGDGQKLSLKAQANGKYFKSFSISFTEPWLGGKRPNSFSISAFVSSQTGVSKSYYNNFYNGYSEGYNMGEANKPLRKELHQYRKVSGFSVGFGKRLTWPDDWFVLYTEAGYQHYNLRNWQYFLMQNGHSHDISLGVTLSRSSIDNPIYTRSGSNFSLGLHFTPPYSWFTDHNWKNEDDEQELYEFIEYHKWSFKGAMFKPLDSVRKLVLMAKFEMGFLGYYDLYRKSPFQKFVMGGDGMSGYSTYGEETIGLRGYENASLTPRKVVNGSYSYDGNIYNKFTMELRYPLTLKPQATVFALAFAEAGNCWSEFQDYSPFDLKRSAGVGLRIFLPMFGLLGIDWGYGFDKVDGFNKAGGSQFHFVMGQSF
ncbi:MAG: outer membrane protein assembly factor BamA [Bacteroidales bacterium]|nr:outer membrane protein assembly factor BamA [Bacteroidales bacterium]